MRACVNACVPEYTHVGVGLAMEQLDALARVYECLQLLLDCR